MGSLHGQLEYRRGFRRGYFAVGISSRSRGWIRIYSVGPLCMICRGKQERHLCAFLDGAFHEGIILHFIIWSWWITARHLVVLCPFNTRHSAGVILGSNCGIRSTHISNLPQSLSDQAWVERLAVFLAKKPPHFQVLEPASQYE